jgi:hypothetical protein
MNNRCFENPNQYCKAAIRTTKTKKQMHHALQLFRQLFISSSFGFYVFALTFIGLVASVDSFSIGFSVIVFNCCFGSFTIN